MFLGGQAHWTVGLVATLMSISSIIAADTFAFLGGKVNIKLPNPSNFSCNYLWFSDVILVEPLPKTSKLYSLNNRITLVDETKN